MTDDRRNSFSSVRSPPDTPAKPKSLYAIDDLTRKRNAAEKRFKAYGIGAIAIGLFFLVVLAVSIISEGVPAFTKTVVEVEFTLTQEQFDEAEGTLFKTKAYEGIFINALQGQLTRVVSAFPSTRPPSSASSASRAAPSASFSRPTRTGSGSRSSSNWRRPPGGRLHERPRHPRKHDRQPLPA